jgi:hypothetical protein
VDTIGSVAAYSVQYGTTQVLFEWNPAMPQGSVAFTYSFMNWTSGANGIEGGKIVISGTGTNNNGVVYLEVTVARTGGNGTTCTMTATGSRMNADGTYTSFPPFTFLLDTSVVAVDTKNQFITNLPVN